METIRMSRKEINQIPIFEQLVKRTIKQREAAKILRLSTRQIKRKLRAYRQHGAASLAHLTRGKPGNHALEESFTRQVSCLVREHYPDFGPTFASEKLALCHGLSINHETLRHLMIREGIWKAKMKKTNAHVYREPKACFGEMIQIDGSLHDWFEGRAPPCSLIAFIDDATSRPVWLEFFTRESTYSIMRSLQSYLLLHGRPLSLYSDRGGVYKVNNNNPDHDKFTQYERALKELDIEAIHARSPQAKGRVERLFGTLQDRLVKELRLQNISSLEAANQYLREVYIPAHNAKFAVQPKVATDLHRTINGFDLAHILCVKEERLLGNDLTVRYHNAWFQLLPKQPTILSPKDQIIVNEHLDGSITLTIRQCVLNFQMLSEKPQKAIPVRPSAPRTYSIPSFDHPWRKSFLGDISIVQLR